MAFLGGLPLPVIGESKPWHGRRVFYNAAGSRLYVVLQAATAANLTNDHAVYTFATPVSCNASLPVSSADVGSEGATVIVNVTAANSCLWQATTNSAWLSPSSAMGAGTATVTVTVPP